MVNKDLNGEHKKVLKNLLKLKFNPLSCKQLIFNVNRNNNHWLNFTVKIAEKVIEIRDPIGGIPGDIRKKLATSRKLQDPFLESCVRILKNYMLLMNLVYNAVYSVKDENYKVVIEDDYTGQINGYDCGVVCLKISHLNALGLPLYFPEATSAQLRKELGMNILRGYLPCKDDAGNIITEPSFYNVKLKQYYKFCQGDNAAVYCKLKEENFEEENIILRKEKEEYIQIIKDLELKLTNNM